MARHIRIDDSKNEGNEPEGRAGRLRDQPGRFGKKPEPEGRKEENASPGRGAIRAVAVAGALAFCASACSETFVDVTPDASGPSACESVSVSTRCEVDTPTHKRCMVYEGNAVEMDGILFTAKEVAPTGRATDFGYEVRDELLECEPTGDAGTILSGEEVTVSIGGQAYIMKAPTVSNTSPPWAMLDVKKDVEEPPLPAECPGQSTRCTEDSFGRDCELRDGMAMEYDGYLWQATDIRMDYGTGAYKLTIIDPESGCGVIGIISGMHEGTIGRATIGGFSYAIEAKRVQAEDDPKWALQRVSREVSYCEAVDIPLECDVGTESGLDTIRCPLYNNMGAIKFGDIMFAIERMYRDEHGTDRVDIRVYNSALGCRTEGGFTNGEFSVSPPLDIGIYRYQATVGSIDRASGVADVRITRELKMCGGMETRGILNVGDRVATARGYHVRLDDITRDGNSGIFTVMDMYGREVTHFVLERHGLLFLSSVGMEIRVNEVAGGMLLLSKWADVTISECE